MAVALPARLKAEDIGFFIPACLRGDALKWHSNELSKDKRTLLARARDCEEWTIELVKRFKMKTSTSLIKIYQTTYGLAEARRGVLARQHANNILKLTKSAEIDAVKARLNYVYMSFAYEFKQDLRGPTDTSTIEDYLNDLDDRQETWDEPAQRGYRRPSPPPLQNRQSLPSRPRDWPLQETTYQYRTPFYGSNSHGTLISRSHHSHRSRPNRASLCLLQKHP